MTKPTDVDALIAEATHAATYPDVRPISYRLVERLVDELQKYRERTDLAVFKNAHAPEPSDVQVHTALSTYLDVNREWAGWETWQIESMRAALRAAGSGVS